MIGSLMFKAGCCDSQAQEEQTGRNTFSSTLIYVWFCYPCEGLVYDLGSLVWV